MPLPRPSTSEYNTLPTLRMKSLRSCHEARGGSREIRTQNSPLPRTLCVGAAASTIAATIAWWFVARNVSGRVPDRVSDATNHHWKLGELTASPTRGDNKLRERKRKKEPRNPVKGNPYRSDSQECERERWGGWAGAPQPPQKPNGIQPNRTEQHVTAHTGDRSDHRRFPPLSANSSNSSVAPPASRSFKHSFSSSLLVNALWPSGDALVLPHKCPWFTTWCQVFLPVPWPCVVDHSVALVSGNPRILLVLSKPCLFERMRISEL